MGPGWVLLGAPGAGAAGLAHRSQLSAQKVSYFTLGSGFLSAQAAERPRLHQEPEQQLPFAQLCREL